MKSEGVAVGVLLGVEVVLETEASDVPTGDGAKEKEDGCAVSIVLFKRGIDTAVATAPAATARPA